MYLEVEIDTNAGGSANTAFKAQEIATAINRIEFQVGTQIWQTLEYQDIMGLASTEMSEGTYREFSNQTSGRYTNTGKAMNKGTYSAAGFTDTTPITADSARIAYIPLKMFTKSIGPELQHFSEKSEGGYLMAAAPNQQVKIKVFTSAMFTPEANNAASDLNIRLFAKNIVMCNEEREQMKAMPMGIPKRIKTTQNANTNIISHTAGAQVQLLDIDHFSLYASHLLITFPKTNYNDVLNVELLLNSSSFSGELPVSLLEIISSSMNLYNNNYIVNGVDADHFDTLVFPLASRAYSGSSVPLNRFDNIRLKIRHKAAAGGQFNITCVGETTALYKGGAASLAMY
jgi:hypothetical protein